MKATKFLPLTLMLFYGHLICAQPTTLCAETFNQQIRHFGKSSTHGKLDCIFENNEYAFRRIEKFMDLAGLPMNFSICKEENIGNAYALMDSSGNRFIIYDQAFLQKLDGDPYNFESATILAHEIGHHLAAHTISINDDNYRQLYNRYCLLSSPDYNLKRCQQESRHYLEISRQQEIEADRFAGYIMKKYNASLKEVTKVYFKMITNYDDTISTHPGLDKRLEAVKAGYELAGLEADEKRRISLQEIKGNSVKLDIHNTDRIARNKLISKVIRAATEASSVVQNQYPYTYATKVFLNGVGYTPSVVSYLAGRSVQETINNDHEYFQANQFEYFAQEDSRLHYGALAGFHIINNVLKIVIFSGDAKPKIVYTSPFQEQKISFEEIKMTFVAIFTNAFEQSIKSLE